LAAKEGGSPSSQWDVTAPATEEAKQFDGYGTALKPAWEPFIVGVKPVDPVEVL
jgi:site-specific DNA-methyltransferase (adenine-specific)